MDAKKIIEIQVALQANGIECSLGDEDGTTIIVWDTEVEKIEKALKNLNVVIRPGLGYDNGTIIYPKK